MIAQNLSLNIHTDKLATLVPDECDLLVSSVSAQVVNRLSTMPETRIRSLAREDPLEKETAIHSSTIA